MIKPETAFDFVNIFFHEKIKKHQLENLIIFMDDEKSVLLNFKS